MQKKKDGSSHSPRLCTASVWPTQVNLASRNTDCDWSDFIWPLVMRSVHFFWSFLVRLWASISLSHSHTHIQSFFLFLPGSLPMFFFLCWLSPFSSSSSPLSLYPSKLSLSVTSKSSLFIQTRSVFPPPPLTLLSSPPSSSSSPWFHACRGSMLGGGGGEICWKECGGNLPLMSEGVERVEVMASSLYFLFFMPSYHDGCVLLMNTHTHKASNDSDHIKKTNKA